MSSVCKCNVYMKYKWNSCLDTGHYPQYFEDIIKVANSNNIPNVKHFWSQGLWQGLYNLGWRVQTGMAYIFLTQEQHCSTECSCSPGDISPAHPEGAEFAYKACMVSLLGLC